MTLLKDLARAVERYRRVLAALAAAVCVLAAISATSAAQTPTRQVVVATHDLPAGTTLTTADLDLRRLRASDVPDRAAAGVDELVGKVVAGGHARGAVMTELSVVTGRAASAPGRVVIAVKATDSEVTRLASAGLRVALLAPGGGGGLITDDALVVAVPQPAPAGPLGTGGESRVLLVDVEAGIAERLVKMAGTSGVTVALH